MKAFEGYVERYNNIIDFIADNFSYSIRENIFSGVDNNDYVSAKESISREIDDLGVELEVDEQTELSNAYITNALNAIKEAQREISKNGLEILNAEDSLVKANDSLMNAKEHGVKAISKTIEAQRILENILKATNNNTEVEDIKIIEEL